MGAKCRLMIDKMMRRMLSNKLRACLCQVVLGVALLGILYGCRMDHPNPSEQGEEGKSVTLDMNLGEIEIDPETIINYVSTSTERGIEMTTPSSDTEPRGVVCIRPLALGIRGRTKKTSLSSSPSSESDRRGTATGMLLGSWSRK